MWCTYKRQILTSFKEMTVKETKKQQTNVTYLNWEPKFEESKQGIPF